MSNRNGRIITENLNEEFKKAKMAGLNRNNNNHGGGYLFRSSIVDKEELPNSIQRKMVRKANYSYSYGMPGPSYGTNIRTGTPSFYHPLFQSLNMMLPRDRRERNEWCRHFYRTEPIIATSLDLHTEFPISDFNNVCYDPAVKKFFDYMAFERLDMINLLLDIGLEYWKIGDVFPFGQLNESDGMWERFVLLNPDYIDIKASIFGGEPIIELIPDEQIKAIVASGPKGPYGDIYNQLPEDVIREVKAGRNIRLDNRLVSHIAHKASQYEIWGTPLMMRCFKTLIYKDKLREAQNSIANRHITPLRIFKVGAPGEPMPSQEDLDSLRDTLMMADDDPNFMLVYHYALQADYVGSSGKILPLNQEFDFIQKELMNGMGINQAMLNGEGPTYANAQVGYDTLARRYMAYRLRLESWIKRKVYKPIAEIQGFYKPEPSELAHGYRVANRKDRQLIIPDISWQQQDLTSNQSLLNFLQQLQAKGLVSMTTILPMLNLDPETEKRNLEAERGTVFDPNAPKTGPINNGPLNTTSPTQPPVGGGGNLPPTQHQNRPNPSDFGFPGGNGSKPTQNQQPSSSPRNNEPIKPEPPKTETKTTSIDNKMIKQSSSLKEIFEGDDSEKKYLKTPRSIRVKRYQGMN